MSIAISEESSVYEPSLRETLDWIPVVSTAAGAVRGFLGTAQVIAGVVTAPFEVLARVFCARKDPFLFARGVSNVVRGAIASVPIAGNITLFFYDHTQFKMNLQKITHIVH